MSRTRDALYLFFFSKEKLKINVRFVKIKKNFFFQRILLPKYRRRTRTNEILHSIFREKIFREQVNSSLASFENVYKKSYCSSRLSLPFHVRKNFFLPLLRLIISIYCVMLRQINVLWNTFKTDSQAVATMLMLFLRNRQS